MLFEPISKLLQKLGARTIMSGQKVEIELTDEIVDKLKTMFGNDINLSEIVENSVSFYIQLTESMKDFKLPETMPTPIVSTSGLTERAIANASRPTPTDLDLGSVSPSHSAKRSDGTLPSNPVPYHDSKGNPVAVNQLEADPGNVDAEVIKRLEEMRKRAEVKQRQINARKRPGTTRMVNSNP